MIISFEERNYLFKNPVNPENPVNPV